MLEQVAAGTLTPDDAMLRIKTEPYIEMGFAKLDTHRGIRQGMAEVIYGAGKTPDQILKIAAEMVREHEKTVLITRCPRKRQTMCRQSWICIMILCAGSGLWERCRNRTGSEKLLAPQVDPAICRWRKRRL